LTYRFDLPNKNVLILFSALLFSFSYATSPFSFFVYFAFIPLIQGLELSKTHKEAFKIGYIVGLIVNALVFYWIIYYKFDSYILIVILNPIQFAVFAYLYSLTKSLSHKARILIFPFLWTFLEYIREFGDLALNWLNIGYTQGNYIRLIQFADITGLNGIVFWICMINVILYNLIFKVIKFKYITINYILLILIFVIPLVYAQWPSSNEKVKNEIYATYLQPNVDSKLKWDKNQVDENISNLIKESKNILIKSYGLLIWPETAIPITIKELGHNKYALKQFSEENNISIITGILVIDSSKSGLNSKYNGALLVSSNRSENQLYHKINLVPVEETLPFRQLYDFIIPNSILNNYYIEGTNETVFLVNLQIFEVKYHQHERDSIEIIEMIRPVKFSTVICFESSFSSFVREFVNNGAEFIVVITNDEWFGYSTQSVQHLITSRFRAIENRKSIVHCSNAGISSFIDFNGKFYGTSELLVKSSSTQLIQLHDEVTLFNRFGDWIGKLSIIFILITFIVIFYKHKKI
jgi:apolipoprotein N-acyltransferase